METINVIGDVRMSSFAFKKKLVSAYLNKAGFYSYDAASLDDDPGPPDPKWNPMDDPFWREMGGRLQRNVDAQGLIRVCEDDLVAFM